MSIRALLIAAVAFVPSARAAVLYDGSLGTSPTSQGLTYQPAGVNFYTVANGATTLNTTLGNAIAAGFGTNAVPLDRAAGYTLRVDARVLSESHAGNNDRAGFSLLVLSSDTRGIELGFHANEIFAQGDDPLFVRAEAAAFDTTAALTTYEIVVRGDAYTLRANGVATLTGPLRDYTAFVGAIDPYETPNAIFLGDDTTSANGSTTFSFVSASSVPEPTMLASLGAIALVACRRRSR